MFQRQERTENQVLPWEVTSKISVTLLLMTNLRKKKKKKVKCAKIVFRNEKMEKHKSGEVFNYNQRTSH